MTIEALKIPCLLYSKLWINLKIGLAKNHHDIYISSDFDVTKLGVGLGLFQ